MGKEIPTQKSFEILQAGIIKKGSDLFFASAK
jgi:hypothetical protein